MAEVQYRPATIRFNPRGSGKVEPWGPPSDIGRHKRASSGGRSPFNGYERTLTAEGGIRISYKDLNRGLLLLILRGILCAAVTLAGTWLILFVWELPQTQMIAGGAVLIAIDWGICKFKIKSRHILEIRPDAMIVDGKDVFYAEDIGDNWPALQVKDNDPERLVISGICGTRFIEYMTANRLDENDRTPEVLAADLRAAMEQLWGRREVTFPAAY
jgi:hypothetical protein